MITRFFTVVIANLLFWAAAFAQAPIVVGAAISQTGPYAEPAEPYRRGLLVWQDEVNAAGGLLGRQVELRILDDESSAARNAALYGQLIRQERAELLIGPYGTAATLMAAATAERGRRVLVSGAAPSWQVHKASPRYVFQTGIPYSAYGAALLALAKAKGLERLFVLAHDDTASKEMAEGLRSAALGREILVYNAGVVDFVPFVQKARAANADGWIAFGGVRDAADMVRGFRRLGYAPRLFFARGAADPKFMPMIGQDAELTLTSIEYDPRLATPGNERFVKAYTAKWSGPPVAAAAEGYVAGTVAAAAVRSAGSLDQEKLREALAALEVETVLGRQKMSKTGAQAAAQPALAQIRGGKLVELAPGELPQTYPQWSERQVLK